MSSERGEKNDPKKNVLVIRHKCVHQEEQWQQQLNDTIRRNKCMRNHKKTEWKHNLSVKFIAEGAAKRRKKKNIT